MVRGLEHYQAGDQPGLQYRGEQVQGDSTKNTVYVFYFYMKCGVAITSRHLAEAIYTCGSPPGGSLVSSPKMIWNMVVVIGRTTINFSSSRGGPVRLVSVVLQILSRQEMQVIYI